jgi:hypothetical protein
MQQICHFLTYLRVSKPALPAMYELALFIPPLMGWEEGGSSDQTVQLFDNALYNIYDL